MAFHIPASEVKHYLMINLLVDHLRKEGYSEIEADHLVSTYGTYERPFSAAFAAW